MSDLMPNSDMTPEEGNSTWNDVTTGAMDTSGDTYMKATSLPPVDVETMNPEDSDDYSLQVDIGSSVPAHGEAVASMDAANGAQSVAKSKAIGVSGPGNMNPMPYGDQQE